ncbi:MAG: hypothetical protein AAF399_12325 [Bacteroidota bacterium]
MTQIVSSHLPIILDVSKLASQGAVLAVYNFPLNRLLSCLTDELTITQWKGLPIEGRGNWQEKQGKTPQALGSFLSNFWRISPRWLSLEIQFGNGMELNSNDEDEIFILFPDRSELDQLVALLLQTEGTIFPTLQTEQYCLELSSKDIQYFDSFRTYLNRASAA